MSSAEAASDFPDEKQRLAVAYSMYEKRNATGYSMQEHPWPKQYSCSFIEPGVVFYQDLGECQVCGSAGSCPNGSCQPAGETILVKQDALSKMAKSFVGKPVINKVHEDVSPSTVADGEADGIVTDVWLDDKTGWWMCKFLVWDPETQRNCESPAYSVSCAYEPKDVDSDGGKYHNMDYHEEVVDGEYTHLAIVTNPRYEGARIFVNSKGEKMSWRFWDKGARKNAAPLDPKTPVDVDGEMVSLQNLYDAMKDEAKNAEPKLSDETVLEHEGQEKTLGELKQAYRNKMKKNADADKCPGCDGTGKKKAENAEGPHHEGEEAPGEKKPLPDLRARANDSAEEAAKKLQDEKKEAADVKLKNDSAEEAAKKLDEGDDEAKKKAVKLVQNEDEKKAKEDEEKKNAADAEAKKEEELEKKNAEDKAAKEKEERRNAGRKSFADLRNAAAERAGSPVKINVVGLDDRLAKGRELYGSAK